MNAEAITVPAMPRLVADDVTSEAAASLLAEQGGRLAVLSAEGGIFTTLAGRYSGAPTSKCSSKATPATCSASTAVPAGRARRPPRAHPRPGRATRGPARHRQHARLPRPRPARPHPVRRPGEHRRPPPHRRRPVPDAGRRPTTTPNLDALVLDAGRLDRPGRPPATPEANDAVLDDRARLEPRLAARPATWPHIVDWASKYTGAIVRIAGLLHLADTGSDGSGADRRRHLDRAA